MTLVNIGIKTEKALRDKFEEVNHLTEEQCIFGQFGYSDKQINDNWFTFRSGALNMLAIQHELLQK